MEIVECYARSVYCFFELGFDLHSLVVRLSEVSNDDTALPVNGSEQVDPRLIGNSGLDYLLFVIEQSLDGGFEVV